MSLYFLNISKMLNTRDDEKPNVIPFLNVFYKILGTRNDVYQAGNLMSISRLVSRLSRLASSSIILHPSLKPPPSPYFSFFPDFRQI